VIRVFARLGHKKTAVLTGGRIFVYEDALFLKRRVVSRDFYVWANIMTLRQSFTEIPSVVFMYLGFFKIFILSLGNIHEIFTSLPLSVYI